MVGGGESEEPQGRGNWFSGAASSVFQGRDVHGDVHFHGPTGPRPARSQVPPVPAHYTNYERALRELDEWLAPGAPGPRLAVLRGPPGSGTTTLACCWVHRHLADFPDGHFFVRLTGSPDGPEQERPALEGLLRDVGFSADEIPASLEGRSHRWRSWSEGKRLALVVDDALTAGQVRAFLPGAGPSALLVTEAGPLAALHALTNVRSVDLTPMEDDAARELLRRLVGRDRVEAEPSPVDELVEICEGSTVALCVVGSLLADLPERPIARLARRLRSDERTLRELSPDAALSVTVAFDAAYGRLERLPRRCYHVVGVHPGAGDVSADAVAVALGEHRDDVLDALDRLARAWLIHEVVEGRYRMSGLTRRHAAAKAAARVGTAPGSGSAVTLRRSLVAYYWARALAAEQLVLPWRGWREAIWPDLRPATDGLTAADAWAWLDVERDNLRAVVELASQLGETRRTAQLCVALWPLHHQRKLPHDMVAVNRLGVAAAQADGDDLCASLLWFQVGSGHRLLGDLDRAAEAFGAGLTCAERIASPPATASAVEALGLVRLDQGRDAEALALLRRNLGLAEELEVPRRTALARFHLAKVEPPEQALHRLDQAQATFEELDERYNLTKVELWRGRRLTESGRLDEARQALTDAAAAADRGGWPLERAMVAEALADLALAQDEIATARSHLDDALAVYRHHYLIPQATTVERRLSELVL